MDESAKIIQKYTRLYLCKILGGTLTNDFECPVCIDKGTLGIKLSCTHKFHFHCIFKWINSDESCPLCRKHIINDNKIKMQHVLTKLKEIFKIPLETLLEFKSAINIRFFGVDQNIFMNLNTYVNKVYNNSNLVDDHNISVIYSKYIILKELQEYIYRFDKSSKSLIMYECSDEKINMIKDRLTLPLEYLVNRKKDHQLEMIVLNQSKLSRKIRSRYSELNRIQKKMDTFEALTINNYNSTPITRTLMPIAFSQMRNNAIFAQLTNELHED